MGDTFLSDIPGTHKQSANIEAVAAGDATEEQAIFVAPFRCIYEGATITPDSDVTGDTTDTKNLNVLDKGVSGDESVELGSLDLITGVDLAANDPKTITTTATLAVSEMLEGQTLTLEIEKVGTGVAIPRSRVEISFRPSPNGV